jgi:hypothetical protein
MSRILLALLAAGPLCVLAQTSGGSDGRPMAEGCVMRDEERRDSWDNVFMLNAYECESRGFCWAVHETPGIPWCFWRSDEGLIEPAACAAASSARKECATAGKSINEKTCAAKGCCWQAGEQGQPWCFYPAGVDLGAGGTPRPKVRAPPKVEAPKVQAPVEPTPPLTSPPPRPTLPPPGWAPHLPDWQQKSEL